MILTDNQGRPFERPDPPPPTATIEEKIAYLRASAAHNDAVSSSAVRAFDQAFQKGLRR